MTLVMRGGVVITAKGAMPLDVSIDDGVVTGLGDIPTGESTTLDVGGCWVGPAFVDLHTHLREPGQEHKEDIESGRRAAAAGGYSDVYAMPNTEPATDTGSRAAGVQRLDGGVRVVPVGAVTQSRAGHALADLEGLWEAGVRMFSDDGDAVVDEQLLTEAMVRLRRLEDDSADLSRTVLSQHAEDPTLCAEGHMHEGVVSRRLGVRGLPASGEESIVRRDLRLVEETGCRYHAQHVSARGTVELIRRAKQARLPVTAEVTPHHLAFDHTTLEDLETVYKMYPPLREPEDVAALREALRDGTIDVVATDHAPHTDSEKGVDFDRAPRGVIGLETAAAVVNTTMDFDSETFFDRMAIGPRRIMGRPDADGLHVGRTADIVVFDPHDSWTVAEFESKSANSPWRGARLRGRVVATLVAGQVVHRVNRPQRVVQ